MLTCQLTLLDGYIAILFR